MAGLRLVLALALVCALAAPQPPARAADARTWWDESIYFVMTDRFRNGDPSNDGDSRPGDLRWWQGGDLQGVIDELPYIKGLGMTAIWLTPVTAQTRGGYHGYWTSDFYAIDPHLGDMAKLQELVARAHALGLKVVLDVVVNHVGYDHRWLADGQHPDWFHPRCNIIDSDQQSVERCWLAGLPDLNTENPAVRAYLEDWSLWLIDQAKVDGFRLDTARHVPKEFLAEWSGRIHAAHPGFWILGEVWSSDYRYQNDYLAAGLDAVTDFYTYDNIGRALRGDVDLSWLRLPAPVAESYLVREPTARATFVDNHDVPRLVGPAPDAAARQRLRLALVDLFTQPGTPVLYYGTEIALAGGNDPDNRRMMPSAGDVDLVTRDLTTRLAHLRQEHAVLRRGAYEKLGADKTSYVFLRRLADSVAVVAINAADAMFEDSYPLSELNLPAESGSEAGLGGAAGTAEVRGGELYVSVPAHSAQVWIFGTPAPRSAPADDRALILLVAGVVMVCVFGASAWLLVRGRRP